MHLNWYVIFNSSWDIDVSFSGPTVRISVINYWVILWNSQYLWSYAEYCQTFCSIGKETNWVLLYNKKNLSLSLSNTCNNWRHSMFHKIPNEAHESTFSTLAFASTYRQYEDNLSKPMFLLNKKALFHKDLQEFWNIWCVIFHISYHCNFFYFLSNNCWVVANILHYLRHTLANNYVISIKI